MKQNVLLKFIKERQKISFEELDLYKISKKDLFDICSYFTWFPSTKEIDGTQYLIFSDSENNEITDFSGFNFGDTYRLIYVLFQNQEDCKKFQEKFASSNADVCKRTISFTIDSYDQLTVNNSKKIPENSLEISHSEQVINYFKNWKEMPEFYYNFSEDQYVKVLGKFNRTFFTNKVLEELLGQNISDKTDSVWFPKKEKNIFNYFRVLGGNTNPKYPIYIVSKGRHDQYYYHTSRSISLIKVHHYICVEPQEVPDYEKSQIAQSEYCHILPMDMSYKGKYNTLGNLGNANATGSGAARNFCADHAKANGYDMCWILDDNTEAFFRYWRGRRITSYSPETFCALERFVERYENIGLAGLNYHMFVINQDQRPSYIINSKVYSYGLWNLKCPYVYQEGRYNEDVIQSLKILETGYWTTVQWNCYLARKLRTQVLKGGNTTEIYDKKYGGTFTKSQMLVERFPQYAKLTWKFDRWHHEVNYHNFHQQLILKPEYKHLMDKDYNEIEENGAYVVQIDPKYHLDLKYDNKEFLEQRYPRGCPEDITNSSIYLPEDRNSIQIRNFWKDEVPGENKLNISVREIPVKPEPIVVLDSPLFPEETEDQSSNTRESENRTLSISEINTKIHNKIIQDSVDFNIDLL